MPSSFTAWTSKFMHNSSKMPPKEARGYPQEGPERRAPKIAQEISRDHQKASPRASGSALEALWTRLERRWGVQGRPREPEMDAK